MRIIIQLMDRQKKESQLLATLSQILKLYQKYLLYSLRPDLAGDRRLGLVENIKERAKAVADRYTDKRIDASECGHNRFLTRLNEKAKAYIDQYDADSLPSILRQNAQLLSSVSNSLFIPEFLPQLFNYEQPTQLNRTIYYRQRKSAPDADKIPIINTQALNNEVRLGCPPVKEAVCFVQPIKVQNNPKPQQKILEMSSLLSMLPMLEIDERQLRRKFGMLEGFALNLIQSNQCISSIHYCYTKIDQVIEPKQMKACTCRNTAEMITSSPTFNQLYTEALERNKNIYAIIKQHEAYHQRFVKKYNTRSLRQKQRDTVAVKRIDTVKDSIGFRMQNNQINTDSRQKITYKVQIQNKLRPNNIRTKMRASIVHTINCSIKTVDSTLHDLEQSIKDDVSKDRCNSQNNPSFPQLKMAKGQKSESLSISETNAFHIQPVKTQLQARKSDGQSKSIKKSSLLPIKKHEILIKSKAIESMSCLASRGKQRTLNSELQLYSEMNSKFLSLDHESTQAKCGHSGNSLKSKQTLSKLLQKVNSSLSVTQSNPSGSMLYLSKIQLHRTDKTDIYSDSNCKIKFNSVAAETKETRKSPLYKQELMQKRAKIEAFYNKIRPSQLGMLRSHIQFPKPQQCQPPSFLMACRSYQRVNQENMSIVNPNSHETSNE